MPTTPQTAHRISNGRRELRQAQTPTKTSSSTGLTSSGTVQDRIRQWQAQGAASAPAPDAVSVRSIPLSACSREGSPAPPAYTPKSAPAKANRWAASEKENTIDGEKSRSGSAPKKRVISDEHWKDKRNAQQNASPTTARKTKAQVPHHDLTYTSTEDNEDRAARRERRRRDRLTRTQTREPLTPETPRHGGPLPSVGQDLNDYVNAELARHLSSPIHPEDAPDDVADAAVSVGDGTEAFWKTSKYAESLGRTEEGSPGQGNKARPRPKGARIFSKTKEKFGKSEPAQTASNRLPSIEAWLEEQPDPFVEGDLQHSNPSPDASSPLRPEPLRRRSRRPKRQSTEPVAFDPNHIWDSVTTADPLERPPRNHHDSPDLPNPEKGQEPSSRRRSRKDSTPEIESDQASPTGLQRRGAHTRRQRRPDRPRQTSTQPENGSFSTFNSANPAPLDSLRHSAPVGIHRLPTIASVETFKENEEPPPYAHDDQPQTCNLKRKLTTHEDLMSVLSLPMNRKSTRTRRKATAMSGDSERQILQDLAAEEEQYLRELMTLVDGVIPVLLQCVLSKSESIAAAGLYTSSTTTQDELELSKPIIDMGVALERLKSLHSRIPLNSVENLLAWVQSAQRPYHDYLQAWRLGFQDVVVNLAPWKEDQGAPDPGMSRDADGDVVDSKGKKVDVAYLLKRPLVRVKNLSKVLTSIEQCTSTSAAKEAARQFSELTACARRRHQEEQARLEDEAAANIDVTRARDIRTLGPNMGVKLDRTRRVRARDCFNLTFYHSTGQRLDCRIEMIFRDNPTDKVSGGDVLICEIEESGKWLLFAPIELSSISARRGEDDFDLVVMIRGPLNIGEEWHELLALKADDPEATAEWMTMLGSNPLPLKLNRARSLKAPEKELMDRSIIHDCGSTTSGNSDTISRLSNVDIPLGEPSVLGASERQSPLSRAQKPLLTRFVPRLNLGGGLQSKQHSQQWAWPIKIGGKSSASSMVSSDRSTISDKSFKDLPAIPKASSAPTTPAGEVSTKERHQRPGTAGKADEYLMSGALLVEERLPVDLQSPSNKKYEDVPNVQADRSPGYSTPRSDKAGNFDISSQNQDRRQPERPGYERKLSSTPSKDLPTITKLRGNSGETDSTASMPLTESIRTQWNALSGGARRKSSQHLPSKTENQIFTEDIPAPLSIPGNRMSLPIALQRSKNKSSDAPPPPPPHRSMSNDSSQAGSVPILEPNRVTKTEKLQRRRSSSPLKHEYAPSTASEETIDSDSDDGSDASSETSNDFLSEVQDTPGPLVAVSGALRRGSKPISTPPVSAPPTSGTRTLAPSDSASQGPYRKVPASSTVPPSKKSRTIALVCSWSERGIWEQLHPDECSIVISPGLIEAFEMSAAHSGAKEGGMLVQEDAESRTSSLTQQPLVAFELTPIVPLRRGTALDINIRSPPTANSKLRTTNNIMFRSRNADECDVLYGMINWARCNNPTYIQLQQARPKQPAVTFNTGQSNAPRSRASSWFSFGGSEKKSSYRASSAPTPGTMSVGGDSNASMGTINSAFSMLKRLGANSAFNLDRSSIRRTGLSRTSGSLYSSSSDNRTGTGSGSSTPIASQLGLVPGKDGPNVPLTSAEAANGGGMVNNMKIRLYARKGQSWENLGSARLSVLPAQDSSPNLRVNGHGTMSDPTTPTRSTPPSAYGQANSRGPRLPSASHTPHRIHGNGREKRIVVRKNKNADAVLLDATLGESCFERVMQTGIAVKVWIEEDEIADRGGVVLGKERIYMLQFPSTKEAGWVFGLCGSYRYGAEG